MHEREIAIRERFDFSMGQLYKKRRTEMKTKTLSVATLVLTLIAASQPVFAQAYGEAYQSFINTLQYNNTYNYTKNSKRSSGTAKSKSTTPDTVPSYGNVVKNTAVTPEQVKRAVQFKSTGTRLALDEYVGSFRTTAEEKAEWKVRLTDSLSGFDALAASKGFPNDVAFALVFSIALNSSVYNETPLVPDGKLLEMREMAAIGLTRYGLLEKSSDREKQGISEYVVMTALMTYYCREKAKGEKDIEELKRCKQVAALNLRRLGVEP